VGNWDLFRRKSAADVLGDAQAAEHSLKRTLGAFDITMLGVGAIIGAGIFASFGQAAAGGDGRLGAGPALILSYLLTAVACGFAALCYAEIAAMVPIAGSAYTYSYLAFGEVVAWIIGWDLTIEYAVGNIYVAASWADYMRSFLRGTFGIDFPAWLATDLQTAANAPEIAAVAPHIGDFVVAFNLPAFLITLLLTILLIIGVKESARVNTGMVIFKVLLVLVFVIVGSFFVDQDNWTPFAPNGWKGIWTGASIAFFSYIGFDAVSTAAEETRDPQKDLPRGIIGSLVICTVLYIATAAVLTGLVPYQKLATADPLAHALELLGFHHLASFMALGAVVAMTAVLLAFQLGGTRIFFAMARDGLLPPSFCRVHPRFRTPYVGTAITGTVVSLAPSILTESQALELTNIGTLFAFVLVSLGVIALRLREPDRPRPFRVPGYPVTPLLSAGCCILLMLGLPASNWWRFGIWLLLGLAIYFAYGRKRSRLAGRPARLLSSPSR
jgi:basic amino acid/polyamine antiporter, APA family